MKKEYAIKVLEALKERSSKIHTLYSFGVNLIDFDEEVTKKMEESIAVLFCNDIEDNYKLIFQMLVGGYMRMLIRLSRLKMAKK